MCGDHPTIRELIDYEAFCGVNTVPQPAATGGATVEELSQRLSNGERPFILDVREPNEFQICRIPGSVLIPLAQLPQRLAELPSRETELIVHCKMGGRSAKAVTQLQERGYAQARNLEGGILAWIDRIDPSQPKY
jgi:adenylyltransferase/sulfurtransferase